MTPRDDLAPCTFQDMSLCVWDAQDFVRQGLGWYNAILSTKHPAGVKKAVIELAKEASCDTTNPAHILRLVEEYVLASKLQRAFGLVANPALKRAV